MSPSRKDRRVHSVALLRSSHATRLPGYLPESSGEGVTAEKGTWQIHSPRPAGIPSLVQGKAPPAHTQEITCLPRPAQPQSHPRGDWSELVGFSGCSPGSLSGREICGRLWLEVVLAKGCGRRALLQPLDMAGVAEQVVLQRVASVTVFIIELQAAVLE